MEETTGKNIRMKIITDIKTLESTLQSTSWVLSRGMRRYISAIKLIEKDIGGYIPWVSTKKQLVDVLTK